MNKLNIIQLKVGELQTNCYLLFEVNSQKTIIIDPGDAADYITTIINDKKLVPVEIIVTHGHFDHLLAAFELQLNFAVPFTMSYKDKFLADNFKKSAEYFLNRKIVESLPKFDKFITKKDVLNIGNQKIEIWETPGHTPGSISLYSKENQMLICGDTVFADGIGRTDFSYSSKKDMESSLQKIFKLPDNIEFFPGHGDSFFPNKNHQFAEI